MVLDTSSQTITGIISLRSEGSIQFCQEDILKKKSELFFPEIRCPKLLPEEKFCLIYQVNQIYFAVLVVLDISTVHLIHGCTIIFTIWIKPVSTFTVSDPFYRTVCQGAGCCYTLENGQSNSWFSNHICHFAK